MRQQLFQIGENRLERRALVGAHDGTLPGGLSFGKYDIVETFTSCVFGSRRTQDFFGYAVSFNGRRNLTFLILFLNPAGCRCFDRVASASALSAAIACIFARCSRI